MTTTQNAKAENPLLQRQWWRQSHYVWDYISRELTVPFLMSLTVIMFVFLLQFLMRFIDKIVGKGLDAWTIAQLIAFNLAWMVVLAVPMAVLVACVMGFGSLSASNELTALKAAGVSLSRMLFPVVILGIAIAFLDLQFNNLVLPDANHKAKDLMSDIQRKKPTFSLEPGQFSDDDAIPGYSILARGVNPQTGELKLVTIYDQSQANETKVLTAMRGKVAFTSDFRNIILTLFDGEFHQYSTITPADYRRGRFTQYVVHVPANGFDFMRQGESERGGRELSANDLLKYVHAKDTTLMRYQTQFAAHLKSNALDFMRPTPLPLPFVPQRPQANIGPSVLQSMRPGQQAILASQAIARSKIAAKSRSKVQKSTAKSVAKADSIRAAVAQAHPQPQPKPDSLAALRMYFQSKIGTLQADVSMIDNAQGDVDSYMVEVHKKYAIPVACIVFVLIGAPLGALARRSGVGVGVGLSIGFFVLYWIFLIGGEKLADRGKLSPFWGMWGGNVLLILVGIYLTWRVAKGRQGTGFKSLITGIGKLFRRRSNSDASNRQMVNGG